jgi:hypothetical protein
MRCHTHPEREAVAVCARCWQPLCAECCAEVEGQSACRGRCEADLELSARYTALVRANAEVYRQSVGPAMGIGFGLMLGAVGWIMFRQAEELASTEMHVIAYIAGSIGLLLILVSLTTFRHPEDAPERKRNRVL